MIKYYFECGLNIIIYNIFQSIVIKQDLWKNPEICFTSSNTKNIFFIPNQMEKANPPIPDIICKIL